ncbi:hypothetical protein AMAG_18872 [Allomyces macrogynus ATCC 38327]|uniref:ABC transporter domain-containing protein n=1 Tax=Allomyces macrogynus (strain ATCC 38327) TaxID=578462 RepID=A0A0L0SJ48_ALLM3|nr:hypothetical protein AMAG_18872 [Allomyces macrogynus ATCC 38327]|eukprot:KNE62502.1 hypothetical protein AMAG_18872 [Allomyces macrogynus ATCC 38327]
MQCSSLTNQKELSGMYIGAINAMLLWSTSPLAATDAAAEIPAGGLKGEKNMTSLLLLSLMLSLTLAAITATSKTDLAGVDAPLTQFQLKSINLSIPHGKLTMVLGAMGSSKTILLHALLGEVVLKCGQVFMPRTHIAYVPQQLWLLNGMAKNRVLFGTVEDCKQDQRVTKACALEYNLLVLEAAGCTHILVTHKVGLVMVWANHLIFLKNSRIEAKANSITALADQLGDTDFHDDAELLTDYVTPMTLMHVPSVALLEITTTLLVRK